MKSYAISDKIYVGLADIQKNIGKEGDEKYMSKSVLLFREALPQIDKILASVAVH